MKNQLVNRDIKGRFTSKEYKKVVNKYKRKTAKEIKFRQFQEKAFTIFAVVALLIIGAAVREHNISQKDGLFIVEASEVVEPISFPVEETKMPVIEVQAEITPVIEEPKCELGFMSNNDGWVEPNQLTLDSIADHDDCEERKILTRLSHYESTQRDICNDWGYCGEFQIGKAAWSDCTRYGISDDSKCAITHFRIDPINRFESVLLNTNSFQEFLIK